MLGCVFQSMIVALTVFVVVFPAAKFNHDAGAGWVISTNNERNFFLGNNPYTHTYKTGHLAFRPLNKLSPDTRDYLRSHYEAAEPRAAMMHSALAYIENAPLEFLLRSFNRLVHYWSFDYEVGRSVQAHLSDRGAPASWLPMVMQAAYSVVLVGFFFFAAARLISTRFKLAVLGLAAVCILYQLPHVLAFSAPIYRSGLAPILTVIASWTVVHFWGERATGGPNGLRGASWRLPLYLGLTLVIINLQAAYYLAALR